MTEDEWLTHQQPGKLVRHLQRKPWQRKLTLFIAECLKEVVSIPALKYLAGNVDEKVRHADNPPKADPGSFSLPSEEILLSRANTVESYKYLGFETIRKFHYGHSHQIAASVLSDARMVMAYLEPDRDEEQSQTTLLRDIFGNPFRPVTFDPRWRTSDVVGLAQAIYDDKAFERMPILADALMDAGCEEEQIIAHCRGDGPHVRGCWVVDLVLEKE